MPSNKNKPDAEEVVMFATRIPKSMKHDLLQLALDKESTVQEIVRFAIENVLTDRPAPPKPKAAETAHGWRNFVPGQTITRPCCVPAATPVAP
jgi:hypothetical protein